MAVDFCAEQVVSPVREGQPTVEFKLFRLPVRLPALDARTRRSFVLVGGAQRPAGASSSHCVPEADVAAKLCISVGGGSMASTRATCSLYFGRTEVLAEARSSTTGEKKQVSIQWST